MKVVGIDLSGSKNSADTCLASFEEQGGNIHLQNILEGADDGQILEALLSLGKEGPILIGVDAPLSYNGTGGDRPSDRDLRRALRAKGVRAGIMPLIMIRMVYLTLRRITITRLLESFKPQYQFDIIEVHPGACMLLHGADAQEVKALKQELPARHQLLRWLEFKGMKGISGHAPLRDHYVAACAAAYGAWQWKLGNSIWKFSASPPHHPYDFAC
ncbi:MAG: DUF429 domain-containing protein [Chloroflexi bacterium]|nr:DUF429 domain-containing protein [Chloroflexota bacterium]